MTKYKLTTDLITDCMALIPENLERLNEGQKMFEVNPGRPNKGHLNEYQNTILFDFQGDIYALVGCDTDSEFYFGQSDIVDFLVISHCLRIIPEFQVKLKPFAVDKETELSEQVRQLVQASINIWSPKTIASATLHGQGEYPPSTLKELCESYKNVME